VKNLCLFRFCVQIKQ